MTRSPPASTYDEDFFAWTQEQAAALRGLPSADVDIVHVAEEIEDLGKRDLREVVSYLKRLVQHLIKIRSCAESRDVPHWRSEARHFADSAFAAFTPSMRQMLDVAAIWRAGRKRALVDLEEAGIVASAPADCPLSLDDVLTDDFDLDAALAKLTVAAP